MLEILKNRFLANPQRHPDIQWSEVETLLTNNPQALNILKLMEESGGEPDTIGYDSAGKLIYCDCSKESPLGRRSLCYDEEALAKRKNNPPVSSVMAHAANMGVKLMDEKLYRHLQSIEEFDLKTSSWIATPAAIREKGGALFCERRYGEVFTFHNGADSYYSSRGYRGYITL